LLVKATPTTANNINCFQATSLKGRCGKLSTAFHQ